MTDADNRTPEDAGMFSDGRISPTRARFGG
jgi:hypothetical protein